MELLRIFVLVVCVIAFTLCVGGGLAILFERWKPTNPNTSKFLVTGVVASAVAAVIPPGGNLFGVSQPPEGEQVADSSTDTSDDKEEATGQEGGSGSAEGSDAAAVDDDNSSTDITEAPDSGEGSTDGRVNLAADRGPEPQPTLKLTEHEAQWAKDIALKPRPFFADPFDFGYPTCLRRIKEREPGSVVTPEDAKECKGLLEGFNDRRILTHQERRQPYINDLSEKSSSGEIEDEQVWQFVERELFSYSDPEGVAYKAFYELGRRYKCDSGLLTNIEKYQLYRPPLLDICQAQETST